MRLKEKPGASSARPVVRSEGLLALAALLAALAALTAARATRLTAGAHAAALAAAAAGAALAHVVVAILICHLTTSLSIRRGDMTGTSQSLAADYVRHTTDAPLAHIGRATSGQP
jgi:hypothetical protein